MSRRGPENVVGYARGEPPVVAADDGMPDVIALVQRYLQQFQRGDFRYYQRWQRLASTVHLKNSTALEEVLLGEDRDLNFEDAFDAQLYHAMLDGVMRKKDAAIAALQQLKKQRHPNSLVCRLLLHDLIDHNITQAEEGDMPLAVYLETAASMGSSLAMVALADQYIQNAEDAGVVPGAPLFEKITSLFEDAWTNHQNLEAINRLADCWLNTPGCEDKVIKLLDKGVEQGDGKSFLMKARMDFEAGEAASAIDKLSKALILRSHDAVSYLFDLFSDGQPIGFTPASVMRFVVDDAIIEWCYDSDFAGDVWRKVHHNEDTAQKQVDGDAIVDVLVEYLHRGIAYTDIPCQARWGLTHALRECAYNSRLDNRLAEAVYLYNLADFVYRRWRNESVWPDMLPEMHKQQRAYLSHIQMAEYWLQRFRQQPVVGLRLHDYMKEGLLNYLALPQVAQSITKSEAFFRSDDGVVDQVLLHRSLQWLSLENLSRVDKGMDYSYDLSILVYGLVVTGDTAETLHDTDAEWVAAWRQQLELAAEAAQESVVKSYDVIPVVSMNKCKRLIELKCRADQIPDDRSLFYALRNSLRRHYAEGVERLKLARLSALSVVCRSKPFIDLPAPVAMNVLSYVHGGVVDVDALHNNTSLRVIVPMRQRYWWDDQRRQSVQPEAGVTSVRSVRRPVCESPRP